MKPNANTALIFGGSGQDGAYLSELLLAQGYEVHGTSRDHDASPFSNLVRLGIRERVQVHSAVLNDFRSVAQTIAKVKPDRIFNLAAQSSVGLSFSHPVETIDSIMHGTINILEAIRFIGLDTRFYNASSSECFGNTVDTGASEDTPFQPRSPYAVGKAASFWAVANYREAYNLYACSGILFNHESPLRPSRYVTQKIVRGVVDISEGKADNLSLGALDIARDWGWAADYVDAMARMLCLDEPHDFVIATGVMVTLKDFVDAAFRCLDLDWTRYVTTDANLLRPSDISISVGDPSRAERVLGWRASITMPTLVDRLVREEILRRRAS